MSKKKKKCRKWENCFAYGLLCYMRTVFKYNTNKQLKKNQIGRINSYCWFFFFVINKYWM